MVAMSASTGDRSVSAGTVMAKKPTQLSIPVRNIDVLESITCGFRTIVISCKDGSVTTGGGMGTTFAVVMDWKGRHVCINAQELLATWVRTFSPEDADAIMQATISTGNEADDAAERLSGKRKRYSGSTREG